MTIILITFGPGWHFTRLVQPNHFTDAADVRQLERLTVGATLGLDVGSVAVRIA